MRSGPSAYCSTATVSHPPARCAQRRPCPWVYKRRLDWFTEYRASLTRIAAHQVQASVVIQEQRRANWRTTVHTTTWAWNKVLLTPEALRRQARQEAGP